MVTSQGPRNRLGALKRLPRRPADFYAVTDMATARRIGGVLWIFGATIVAILLPVAPPTHHLDGLGWAVGAAIVALCLLSAVPLLRMPERVSPNALLGMSYVSVTLIVALVWMGGHAYSELFIIPVVYVATVHPPRRVGAFMLVLALALAAPLFYDGWNADLAAEMVAKLLLWSSLTAVAILFTATVRVQRMELREEEEEASALARRDALTGLGNRRGFDEALERLVRSERASDRPLTLAVADIQGFKAINDRLGHVEGDRCLREVARALQRAVRAPDFCFRWGGDEFAVLLAGADYPAAQAAIDRVGHAVADSVALRGDEDLCLKFGLAELEPGMTVRDLVAAADLELMAAKARDREAPTPS